MFEHTFSNQPTTTSVETDFILETLSNSCYFSSIGNHKSVWMSVSKFDWWVIFHKRFKEYMQYFQYDYYRNKCESNLIGGFCELLSISNMITAV